VARSGEDRKPALVLLEKKPHIREEGTGPPAISQETVYHGPDQSVPMTGKKTSLWRGEGGGGERGLSC